LPAVENPPAFAFSAVCRTLESSNTGELAVAQPLQFVAQPRRVLKLEIGAGIDRDSVAIVSSDCHRSPLLAKSQEQLLDVFTIRTAAPVSAGGIYITPFAPDTREQTVAATEFEGCRVLGIVRARGSAQRGILLELLEGDEPAIRYRFREPGAGLDLSAFAAGTSRFDRPSEALAAQVVAALPDGAAHDRVPALMQFIADRFTYGNRERRLGDDTEAMPPLDACDLTRGNCVDMHTTAVAALRALGMPATYVIGCFVYEGMDEYPTGHCWLNVDAPGAPHHYDISHHVEYGLGPVTPALNPKPGRRFALATGRALQFDGPEGTVELPSLSGFHALSGTARGQKLRTIGRFG
jgi:hypothetical protein